MVAMYKKHCVDQLSFRVCSLDASYKYTMAVREETDGGNVPAIPGRSEYRNVHVLMADKVRGRGRRCKGES